VHDRCATVCSNVIVTGVGSEQLQWFVMICWCCIHLLRQSTAFCLHYESAQLAYRVCAAAAAAAVSL
jgi:hypothetical protein